MDAISVSQLKVNPAKAMAQAGDYPMMIESRGVTKAYLVGKELFEKVISYLEDHADVKAAKEADFAKGRDFEEVARELDL